MPMSFPSHAWSYALDYLKRRVPSRRFLFEFHFLIRTMFVFCVLHIIFIHEGKQEEDRRKGWRLNCTTAADFCFLLTQNSTQLAGPAVHAVSSLIKGLCYGCKMHETGQRGRCWWAVDGTAVFPWPGKEFLLSQHCSSCFATQQMQPPTTYSWHLCSVHLLNLVWLFFMSFSLCPSFHLCCMDVSSVVWLRPAGSSFLKLENQGDECFLCN